MNLDNWLKEVDVHAQKSVQIIVMANKQDLVESEGDQREVSEEEIQDFTKRTGLTVFEASAKSGYGVESSFIALTDALMLDADKKVNSFAAAQ